jgi:hypothetical protein
MGRSDIDCPVCTEHTLARTTVELILADNPGLMKAWKHAVLDSQVRVPYQSLRGSSK